MAMHFGNINALGLLWIMPALVLLFVWAGIKRRRALRAFVDSELIGRVTLTASPQHRRLKAVLLIAAILPAEQLAALLRVTQELGMTALVEAHNAAEVRTAVDSGAEIIGINNRDLKTFTVDLAVTEKLRPLVPLDRVLVSESGIHSREDVLRLERLGVDAVLVGESLMRAPDIGAALRGLR